MSLARIVSFSGGKDSTACAILCSERHRGEDIRLVMADTGNEHPLTIEYANYVSDKLSMPLTIVKADMTPLINRTRARLEKIAAGEPEKQEYKYPWTPEAAAEALKHLHPTGNPFLDMCMAKGAFPSHARQYCTELLKAEPMMEYVDALLESGTHVESWQGVRRDESRRRAHLTEREDIGGGYTIYRPIIDWTAQQCIDLALDRGMRINDLYMMGQKRVGCMPCINVSKMDLREIALRFPEHIDRIEAWEKLVQKVTRPGNQVSFLYSGMKRPNIRAMVEWSKTSHGGTQYDLLQETDPISCSSAYGLCE